MFTSGGFVSRTIVKNVPPKNLVVYLDAGTLSWTSLETWTLETGVWDST